MVACSAVHLATSKAENSAVRKEFSMVVGKEDWWVGLMVAWMDDEMVANWVVQWVVGMDNSQVASMVVNSAAS